MRSTELTVESRFDSGARFHALHMCEDVWKLCCVDHAAFDPTREGVELGRAQAVGFGRFTLHFRDRRRVIGPSIAADTMRMGDMDGGAHIAVKGLQSCKLEHIA